MLKSNKPLPKNIHESHTTIIDTKEYPTNNKYDMTFIMQECINTEINNITSSKKPVIRNSTLAE